VALGNYPRRVTCSLEFHSEAVRADFPYPELNVRVLCCQDDANQVDCLRIDFRAEIYGFQRFRLIAVKRSDLIVNRTPLSFVFPCCRLRTINLRKISSTFIWMARQRDDIKFWYRIYISNFMKLGEWHTGRKKLKAKSLVAFAVVRPHQ
jgi:hypothetical protein